MTMTASAPGTEPGSVTPRRFGARAVGAAVVVVIVAAIAGWAVHRHQHVGSAPYADPASAGRLTLCKDGKPVTRGKTTDQPFATAVVGSQRGSGAYAAAGRTATLLAYQPRGGIDPESWSGLQLSGTSTYVDPSAPTVSQDRTATTLAQFINGFPALDGGWVQLRLVLGAPGARAQTTSYATADIRVRGTSWTLADPGHATCPSS